jgi:hypothetical protein
MKDELSGLLAAVHAAMMSIPLAEGFCPERWRQAIDIMLEKITGVPKINKLRITRILEADLNQVLRSVLHEILANLHKTRRVSLASINTGDPIKCASPQF